MKRNWLILSLVFFLVLGIMADLAMANELTGSQVLDKVEAAVSADTLQMEFEMTLYNSDGRTRERELTVKKKEVDGVDKSFIRFLAPPSVEGTGFLSEDYSDDDNMYLYMPSIGSVRRIASGQKDSSFVGTDFTYNDLSLIGGEDYKSDYTAEIIEETDEEYILRMVPMDDEIEYDYGEMQVQKSNWFPVEIKFYENEKFIKHLINKDIVEIDGYWTAREVTMKDIENETKTVLQMNEIIYDQSIDDRLFTTRYLERY
jgi:outer membrane lipoprotein-sorting protein